MGALCRLVLGLVLSSLSPTGARAGLLAGALEAPVTVTGVVHEPTPLDPHGWAAELTVDRVLAGGLSPDPNAARPSGEAAVPTETAVKPGERLRFAWEELGRATTGRFREGDRLLLSLAPLPDLSLWKERFPGGEVRVVADRGGAYVRDPEPAGVELVAALLALPAEARRGPAGAELLAGMVERAQPLLAGEALARLAASPEAWKNSSKARESLAKTLSDEARPIELRRGVLALAGGIPALRSPVGRLAQPGSPLEAEALDALGRLDGGFGPERVQALMERSEPAIRAVAVRRGGQGLAVDALGTLVRQDAAPEVRLEAVVELVRRGDLAALDAAAPALFDADSRVRSEAARRIGGVGSLAVPSLRRLALGRDAPEAGAPIGALLFAGAPGRAALGEIAESHRDPRVRELARIALGQPRAPH